MRILARIAGLGAVALLIGAAPADLPQPLTVGVEGLRSPRGLLQICLTRLPDHFPDCTGDPDKRHFSIPAAQAANMALGDLPPGGYAIAIIHDQNSNKKLDTFMGIPKEGVGFSENPPIRFGAPSFRAARFAVGGAAARQDIRMKYFL
ncbi:DUF2141 domain-containing protein [Sphingobium phenoxybenzoativorans]|uniref:DUF2141 domain-containing protein n=1 Tax=Sphingobium phenoxybenzoativorans TaxID=1592790 RepID=A0A975K738_9SPHN|nr:DUF2141 domain-containing protein [Sphingobium phenoxybenzoativorans]QUT06006.1 DUF2141 domain-containing protein [Sphingobium phenoxybenzoativorans]